MASEMEISGLEGVVRDSLREELYRSTLNLDWKEVVKIYEQHSYLHATRITKSGDTALHVAAVHGPEHIVIQLVGKIKKTSNPEVMVALSAQNKSGDTPLHCAASRGSLAMCKCILSGDEYSSLVHLRNNDQETPLFLAALDGHKETFLFLHCASIRSPSSSGDPWRRKEGDTILHCALQKEYFDLAFQIIHLYKDQSIATIVNESGITPLHVLASKPSAFRSGTQLPLWTNLLYYCTIVGPLQVAMRPAEFQSVDICTSEDNKRNHCTCHKLFGLLSRTPLNVLIKVRKIREKHVWCSQIMRELLQQQFQYEYFDDGTDQFLETSSGHQQEIFRAYKGQSKNEVQQNQQDKTSKTEDKEKEKEKMTILLTAAKNGVTDIVNRILGKVPIAIHERTTKNKNILIVAVENRQPYIIQALKSRDSWYSLTQTVDNEGNNALHLAAKATTNNPWQILGSALQMQWETKWYQFVKETLPPHLISQANNEGCTPGEIFAKSHKEQVKEGNEWLKSTSESCSVVAALIAGVSFATSATVPGGNNDQTGKPTLEGQRAFNVFAIASLVALCFSVTALVTFLAILTSRRQPRDFRVDLPLKLLFGLTSLFVSIASMLASFCAAYFFMLEDRMHNSVFIIYATIFLPVSFFAVAQFPLYFDLLTAIFTEVPRPSYKEDDL